MMMMVFLYGNNSSWNEMNWNGMNEWKILFPFFLGIFSFDDNINDDDDDDKNTWLLNTE